MLSRWKRWTASLEVSPEVENAMYREFRFLFYFAGLFLHPKRPSLSIVQLVISISIIGFFGVCLFTTVFVMMPDLVELSRTLNYVALTLCVYAMFGGFLSNRDAIVKMLFIISKDFYAYGDTFALKEMESWKTELTRFKLIVVVALPMYFGVVGVTVMFKEYIDAAFGYDTTPTSDYDEAGIYQLSPIKMWYPFPVYGLSGRVTVFLLLAASATIHATTLACAVVFFVFFGRTLNLQMKILYTAIIQMEERATNMYANQTGLEPPKDHLKRTADKILDACRQEALKQVVEHHLVILEFYDAYATLSKWPTGVAVFNGSIVVAMSILAFMAGVGEVPSTAINSSCLLGGEFLSLVLMCEIGEQISIWNEKVFNGMYEFNWPDFSTSNNKYVLIFRERAKQPMQLMAGGMSPINRDTFSGIMNTAYSYVNLLRAAE